MLRVSDFNYRLPKELIAQFPVGKRDESRLLILDRKTGKVEHKVFRDIIEYLNPGDALVLNDTKVVPARLVGKKSTGGRVEILLLNPVDPSLLPNSDVYCSSEAAPLCSRLSSNNKGAAESRTNLYFLFGNRLNLTRLEYEALVRPLRGIKLGSRIDFGNSKLKADVIGIYNGKIFLKFYWNGDFRALLTKFGRTPLPPYIKHDPIDIDKKRYQTVYAKKEGAIAAPTAGLHFTKSLLKKIEDKGIKIEYLTLQVGYGTFKPVKCRDVRLHKMEEEYFEVSEKTIGRLKEIKRKGGRIFAVGTTTCRVLETVYDCKGWTLHNLRGCAGVNLFAMTDGHYQGWTRLFIYPSYNFKSVDALVTNFHLPKTTLLMLVSAFCGRGLLFKAYQEAIEERYRFYSYGDAMLIL